ncbi:MAG: hypothetical protein UY41_C0056G0007 [Candidatus Moranbacteria bacterium GW2011_GWE1_49_15]|nr:MAG: hypothetical protein UX75_C0015G0025 [Candidatus Moranbacteria bacterium GW2011_GWE2_47_10]KKW05311.1 MAG: hypothetical protein UY41_C0056G0007 [Candidatus Moranbacteria bacterium GW2011_GWE1_49_15]HBP00684.1 hypothetical protein [Candidatus Moranbacteria bacterium]
MKTGNFLITAFFVIFLALSFSYLSYVETKNSDYSHGKNWWSLYFDDPKSEGLSFYVENFSDAEEFFWEIKFEENTVRKGSTVVSRGEKGLVPISSSGLEGRQISIEVSGGGDSKKIYKNF